MALTAIATAALLARLAVPDTTPGPMLERRYQGEGGERAYHVYAPAALRPGRPAPLVVMLHGCAQSPADFAAGARINELADELGFVVAYPDQPATANPWKCWNWYLPGHQHRGGGEPAAVAGIAGEVMREHAVDPRRVYLAGISAGAAMAVAVATAYPDLFAAVAAHSGPPHAVATDLGAALRLMREGPPAGVPAPRLTEAMGPRARPLPAILIHGAADTLVHPANQAALAEQWLAAARAARLPLFPDPDTAGGHRVFRNHHGLPWLEVWLIPGLGHAWSGGSAAGSFTDPRGPDAARRIMDFLFRHSRDAPEGE